MIFGTRGVFRGSNIWMVIIAFVSVAYIVVLRAEILRLRITAKALQGLYICVCVLCIVFFNVWYGYVCLLFVIVCLYVSVSVCLCMCLPVGIFVYLYACVCVCMCVPVCFA